MSRKKKSVEEIDNLEQFPIILPDPVEVDEAPEEPEDDLDADLLPEIPSFSIPEEQEMPSLEESTLEPAPKVVEKASDKPAEAVEAPAKVEVHPSSKKTSKALNDLSEKRGLQSKKKSLSKMGATSKKYALARTELPSNLRDRV